MIFSNLNLETKLYIVNPFSIGTFKSNSNKIFDFPELVKKDYLKKSSMCIKSKKLVVSTPKISILKYIYLFLTITNQVLGYSNLVIM